MKFSQNFELVLKSTYKAFITKLHLDTPDMQTEVLWFFFLIFGLEVSNSDIVNIIKLMSQISNLYIIAESNR